MHTCTRTFAPPLSPYQSAHTVSLLRDGELRWPQDEWMKLHEMSTHRQHMGGICGVLCRARMFSVSPCGFIPVALVCSHITLIWGLYNSRLLLFPCCCVPQSIHLCLSHSVFTLSFQSSFSFLFFFGVLMFVFPSSGVWCHHFRLFRRVA